MEFDLDGMYCGHARRGDIFLITLAGKKKQPVVVVQDDVLNERLGTVVVVPIMPYRKGEKVFKNEVLLTKREIGFGRTGIALLHKIQTVDRRLLVAKKGEIGREKLAALFDALQINWGRFRD